VTQPTAAVVVCAYTMERWDDLCAALRSAARQDPAPQELWLVIDHNDDLLARARTELTAELPTLQVVANDRRQGLSGARNSVLERVGGEVVVFLDDDASAEPGWLAALTAPYADPEVLVVGGVAKPRWPVDAARPVTLPSAGPEGSWSVRGELDWVVGCTYAGQPTELAPVRNVMGCNMSFRRSVFAELGGFSEDLGRVGKVPLGCEETELCIRASNLFPGARILMEPLARVRHHVSTDRLTWSYLRRRCYAEGVSKAAVAAMVGRNAALATERGYATRVLPAGVARELGSVGRGRPGRSLAGAVAIVVGLAATAGGYARGRAGVRKIHPTHPQLRLAAPQGAPASGRLPV